MAVLEYLRKQYLPKLHVSECLLLEVRFGCGSSTKIKTADNEPLICATVVTFKKENMGGRKITFGRYARGGDRTKFA